MNKPRPIQDVFYFIMKITLTQFLLMVILTSLVSAASLRGQGILDRKVSLNAENSDMKSILSEIEKQTSVVFTYRPRLIKGSKKISFKVTDARLADVLEQLFSPEIAYLAVDEEEEIVLRSSGDLSAIDETSVSREIYVITISGTVADETGQTLPGVNVMEKGTTNGTTTDVSGRFSLGVHDENSVLVFSFIGYTTQEVPVRGQTEFSINLQPDVKTLDEVVVIGYGAQKRVNVTGSIASVNMDQLENTPLTNATQALQGVQGVYVNQAGGQPGRDLATIRIRGQGTLNDNNALVLVNGIEYPLSDVNPNDIESISVLKDAASAAIYGSRAANGVIIVTTKSGAKDNFQVKYNAYYGAQAVNYLPDVVKDPVLFMELRNQAMINGGRLVLDYSQSLIDEYRAGMATDPYTYPNNDWFDIMFNPAAIQEHNLQFSGGAENITYLLSLGYLDQDGVIMGSNSNRYSVGFNSTIQVSRKLKIGSTINGNYRIIEEPVAGVTELMGSILKAQAFHPTYLEDGRYANTFIRSTGHNLFRHPIVMATEGENQTAQQRYLVNLFAEYELPFSIRYKVNIGLNKADNLNTVFVPDIYIYQNKTGEAQRVPFTSLAYGPVTNQSTYAQNSNRSTRKTNSGELNTTIFNTLNWVHSFNETHNISTLLGVSSESFNNNIFWGQNEGYLANDLYELNAGSSNPAVFSTSSSSRLNSYFGRVGYNYKDRYLFEANFRYDGSSRFARDKRWGLFPSFSAGWRMEREKWLEDVSWLSDFKIRASWGQLGNERIGLFRYLNLMSLGQDYSFGTNVTSGAAVTAYNDPNITWETTTISNIGLDAGIFDNRLNLVFDVFKKRTTDILRAVNLPSQVGNLPGPIRNIGTVDNSGFEVGLNYQNQANDFTYKVDASVTKIKNEVVSLNGQTIFNGSQIIKEGYPINSYNLIHAVGIFQSQEEIDNSPFQTAATKPGYLKYQDTNGDGFITEDDRMINGGVIPEYTYQFTVNLGYKGFAVSAFFQGVQNINTYASLIAAQPFWFGTAVTKEWITDAWTPERPNSRLPILTTYESSVNENFRNSDFWLRDASYLRMKNVQVSYTLPQRVTGRVGMSNLQFYLSGQNLLTVSKMKDFDPEKNIDGVNFYEYPTVKMYTMGINATF